MNRPSWVDAEIKRWRDYQPRLNPARGFNLIPAEVQVGKILETFDGPHVIADTYLFITRQIREEGELAHDDGYWQKVMRRFDELKVNDEIMTE